MYTWHERAFITERVVLMKKLSILLCSIALVGCANNASVKESSKTSVSDDTTVADTFTGASEGKYFYKDSALTDDALWNVMASYQAAPTIATVNPDGSPNLAVFMPGLPMELDGERYFVFGLSDNQTKLNLEQNKTGVLALYQYDPTAEDKMERNVGARIKFEIVEDEKIIEALYNFLFRSFSSLSDAYFFSKSFDFLNKLIPCLTLFFNASNFDKYSCPSNA